MHAVPLRLRGETIGALNLFGHQSGSMPEQNLLSARVLADIATIGILQERAIRRAEVLTGQLHRWPSAGTCPGWCRRCGAVRVVSE